MKSVTAYRWQQVAQVSSSPSRLSCSMFYREQNDRLPCQGVFSIFSMIVLIQVKRIQHGCAGPLVMDASYAGAPAWSGNFFKVKRVEFWQTPGAFLFRFRGLSIIRVCGLKLCTLVRRFKLHIAYKLEGQVLFHSLRVVVVQQGNSACQNPIHSRHESW